MEEKFEEVKKEIRSLLISYQKGTSLSEFQREYRKFIGRRLPSQEFNYRDDISFLYDMPDAVAIYPSPVPGDYHLMGIADKSVAHIQKMVCKQKPTKHRTSYRMPRAIPPRSTFARQTPASFSSSKQRTTYEMFERPPRFSKKELPDGVVRHVINMLENYPFGLKLHAFLDAFCCHYKRQFTFKDWGYVTLEECLEAIPGLNAKTKNNEIVVHLTKNDFPKEKPSRPLETPRNRGNTINSTASSPAPNISSLNNQVGYLDREFCENGASASVNSKETFNQSSSSKETTNNYLLNRYVEESYNQNCTQNTPGLPPENHSLIDCNTINSTVSSHISNTSPLNKQADFFDRGFSKNGEYTEITPIEKEHPMKIKSSKLDTLDDFQLSGYREEPKSEEKAVNIFEPKPESYSALEVYQKNNQEDITPLVSELIKQNVRKVMEQYPHGLFAVDFPNCYKNVTNSPLDLHSLGFYHIADFIDAMPDIVMRKILDGSKKDWIICPVNVTESSDFLDSGKCLLFIESVIINTRKILQASPEGIKLSEFITTYSINCKEPLYIRDLGFDNIENFLLSIAPRVPLRINSNCDQKIVCIENFEEKVNHLPIKPPVAPVQNILPSDVASSKAKFKDLLLPSNFDFSVYHPVYTASIKSPGLLYIQLQGDKYSDALKILYDEIDAFYKGQFSQLYMMRPEDIKEDTACVALWPGDNYWYRAEIKKLVSMDHVLVFYGDYGTTEEIPTYMLRYIKESYLKLPVQALKSKLAYMKPPNNAKTWASKCQRRMLELCQDVPLMASIENIKDNVLYLILCDTNGEEDKYINDMLVCEDLAEFSSELDEQQETISPTMEGQDVLKVLAESIHTTPDNLKRIMQNLALSNMTGTPLVPQQHFTAPVFQPSISESKNYSLQNGGFGATAQTFMTPILPPVYPQNTKVPANKEFQYPIYQTVQTGFPFTEQSPPRTPSPDELEVFDEDDDDLFEQFYQKFSSRNSNGKKRLVKRVKTEDGYVFHVLLYNSKPFVASGDISFLIWSGKRPTHLMDMLQTQQIELPSLTLSEEGNEEFFLQLERFSVKGIQKSVDIGTSILMYPLESINQILNAFGHPSAAVRAKINTEFKNFNPSSPHWQELPDSEMPEEIEEFPSVTDDAKLSRLCLYDLKAMKEGIRCKRKNLLTKHSGSNAEIINQDEINKLNLLFTKVRERISEIEQICKMFS